LSGDSPAGTIAWSAGSLANVASSNNLYVQTANKGSGYTETLWIRNFDFASELPPSATNICIELHIERSAVSGTTHVDGLVQLCTAFSIAARIGDNKASATNWPPTTDAVETYGDSTDDWNAGLTYAMAIEVDFGIQLRLNKSSTGAARIDFVEMRLHYDEALTAVGDDCTHELSDTGVVLNFVAYVLSDSATHELSSTAPTNTAAVGTTIGSAAHVLSDIGAAARMTPTAEAASATHVLSNTAAVALAHITTTPASAVHAHTAAGSSGIAHALAAIQSAQHLHSASAPTVYSAAVYHDQLAVDVDIPWLERRFAEVFTPTPTGV
jgi:hypothetical protein